MTNPSSSSFTTSSSIKEARVATGHVSAEELTSAFYAFVAQLGRNYNIEDLPHRLSWVLPSSLEIS